MSIRIIVILVLLVINIPWTLAQRNCGSIYNQAYVKSLPQSVQLKLESFNKQLEDKQQRNNQATSSALSSIPENDYIFIPVVVHVVWNNANQNVTDAQICSQISVLNEDFNRSNADAVNTPQAFQFAASNPRIQFYLATIDPNGNPTNGITRTNTTTTSFSQNSGVKFNNTGGHNAWPADRYLNLWVCNLGFVSGSQLLGYAQFPDRLSSQPTTDGVVIHWQVFGRGVGFNLLPSFNLGRTATHEVGHWMGLIHIWGDDFGACSDSDLIADTPNQANSSLNVPTFPRVDNCSPVSPGIMFMNYMDYTDDVAMNLFTGGQSSRMRANFNTSGFRANANYATGIIISGNEPICANSTFSVNGLPANFIIGSWISSNPSALTINSSGVATRQSNFNGPVDITAIIAGGCNNIRLSKTIWVGNPTITYSPPGANPCLQNPYYSAPLITGVSYQWSVDNPNVWFTSGTTNSNASVISYNPEYFTITLSISNGTCTTTSSQFSYTAGYYCQCFFDPACNGGFSRFSASPNPASNQVDVTFDDKEYEKELKRFGSIEYGLALVDEQGNVVAKVKTSDKTYKWDTSKIPNGTYYLKINYKSFGETKRILIKH